MIGWAVDVVLVVAAVLATVADLRERRIYNAITYPTILAGLGLALLTAGLGEGWTSPGLLSALLGLASAGGFFLVVHFAGGMGLGDVKLMAGIGALLGFPAALGALLFVTIAGGALGVCAALLRTAPGRKLGARLRVPGIDTPAFGRSVPYGVAIAAGALTFRLWQRLPPG